VPTPDSIDIANEVPADLPTVWIDRTQFRQVMVNLLANAVEAINGSAKGSRVAVTAWLDDRTLMLTTTDDGPGIPPEVRLDLFEPLVTTRKTGNGLGLALCKRIVEKHGGTIVADEAAPSGARIVIRVPDALAST
jgi:signal transduction histidine kinase